MISCGFSWISGSCQAVSDGLEGLVEEHYLRFQPLWHSVLCQKELVSTNAQAVAVTWSGTVARICSDRP